jgi:glycosyltransferase involved in cell wall biosynthesis
VGRGLCSRDGGPEFNRTLMTLKRTRVLFTFPYPSLAGGGAQRVLSILLRDLDRDRFEPHLALMDPQRGENDDIPADVVVHDLGTRRARYTLLALARIVKSVRPDVILSTLGHMNLAVLLAKRIGLFPSGTRVVIRESTTPSAYLRHSSHFPGSWIASYRFLYKRADKIICLSEAMKHDLIGNFGVPEAKLVTIYNPVDIERIRHQAQSESAPFPAQGPNLVAAGRFVREKGYDLLLHAMPLVLMAFPQAQLILVGDGPLSGALRDQAKALGISQAVTFVGMQPNPWLYFRHADLVIVPSRFDGFPNVALEALAAGARVVAADCPGAIREINQNNELTLVPPEDPEALAQAIVSGLNIREQRSYDLSRFSVAQIVEQYTNVLEGNSHVKE